MQGEFDHERDGFVDPNQVADVNPYQSAPTLQQPSDPYYQGYYGGKVNLVNLLGILMIVNGGLTSLFGIYGIVMAFVMPNMLAQDPNNPMEPEMATFMVVFMAIYGGGFLVVALLSIFAGINVLKFRGYVLAMVALFSSMLTIMTCYCFPTSLALMIFGLVVLLDPAVKNAFRAVASGATVDSILKQNTVMSGPTYYQQK